MNSDSEPTWISILCSHHSRDCSGMNFLLRTNLVHSRLFLASRRLDFDLHFDLSVFANFWMQTPFLFDYWLRLNTFNLSRIMPFETSSQHSSFRSCNQESQFAEMIIQISIYKVHNQATNSSHVLNFPFLLLKDSSFFNRDNSISHTSAFCIHKMLFKFEQAVNSLTSRR